MALAVGDHSLLFAASALRGRRRRVEPAPRQAGAVTPDSWYEPT
jgi:hypothetical protein